MEFSDILNLAPLFKILAKKQLISHRICRITLIGCHNFVLMHLIETLKGFRLYTQRTHFWRFCGYLRLCYVKNDTLR